MFVLECLNKPLFKKKFHSKHFVPLTIDKRNVLIFFVVFGAYLHR